MTPNPSSVFGGKRPRTQLSARPPLNKAFEDMPVLPKTNVLEVQRVFADALQQLKQHAQFARGGWGAATLASACELLKTLFFKDHKVDVGQLDDHVVSDVRFGFAAACIKACLYGIPGQRAAWYFEYKDRALDHISAQLLKQRFHSGVRLAS